MVSSVARADVIVEFGINVSPGFYSAAILPGFFPGHPDIAFVNGTIASDDGVFQATTNGGGWSLQAGTFSTLGELKSAVQQSWTFELDQGLPTQRSYTMTLDIDGLEEADIAPPVISFPASDETIQTLSPNFEFDLQIPQSHSLQLHRFPLGSGSSTILAQTGVAAGTTSWSPGFSLSPDTRYLFGLRTSVTFPEFGFSVPVDAADVPLADWQSFVSANPETNIVFYTAVPEPSAVVLLAVGGAALLPWQLRRRQKA